MFRKVAAALLPIYWRLRTLGRVRGGRFILVPPARVRVTRGGRITLGEGVVIERDARIVVRGKLVISDNVYISKNVTIVAFESVTIGPGTLIAENVSIHDEDHGPASDRNDFQSAPIHIGSKVWLCAGALITRGVTIGEGTTIGGNAVVVKDVPAGVLAVGTPATVKKKLIGGA